MKKYVYEAAKNQWEKPTEPRYIFCRKAQIAVTAETEEEARAIAAARLREQYLGTGVILGEVQLADIKDLPVDWSYGYGDERRSGDTAAIGDLVGNNVIR
jgi:hypothetical protein